jgi:hypothetical protein
MAEANDPSASGTQAAAGIQATPPTKLAPETARIPLPPLRSEPITPEEMIRSTRRLDRTLVVMALLVAFFLASFSIRNSDLFMHMATGRALLRGDYHFGTDPFSSTTAGIYWVNHAWLFDLLVYGVYQLGGGVGLVVARCLIIIGLAIFLMRTCRPGQSLWAPAGCTGLALLAMSPRFLMQPVLLSYLFLAVTLYLLERSRPRFGVAWDHVPDRRHGSAKPDGWSPLWLLPPLFVLWVNCDDWFLLGPLTVILYGLGELFQELFNPVSAGPDVPDRSRRKTLALVTVAGLAACLVNPHHIHGAFTLPAQLPLNPAALALQAASDSEFVSIFARPSDPDYFRSTGLGGSRAALAVLPLLGLGLLSFMVNSAGWRWWRGLVWVAFLLLGLYHGRAIPFFALVSAPILALNFQDFAARRFGQSVRTARAWKEWSIGGRVVTVVAGVALLATAWPGWLHSSPDNPQLSRRVAWDLRVDDSLKKLAENLGEWRKQGFLTPDDHCFNATTDIAHYCAWYSPEEKCFFDLRFELYPDTAQAFLDIRKALDGTVEDPAAFEKLFRDKRHPVNHVLLAGIRPGSSLGAFARLASDERRWSLMHVSGQGAVFGWLDSQNPARRDVFAKQRLDNDRLAFGPNAVQAPAEGPGRLPERKEWWELYPVGPAPQQAAGEEAQLFVYQFNFQMPRYQQRQQLIVEIMGAAESVTLPGLSFGLTGPRMLQTGNFVLPRELGRFLGVVHASEQDRGPPAAAFLAIRAARRALAVNPDDARAHAALGQAYLQLLTQTREGRFAKPFADPRDRFPKQLMDMRYAQSMSALVNWAAIEPDALDAHRLLYLNYQRLDNREKARDHLDVLVKLLRARGKPAGVAQEEFAQQMADLEKEYKDLESDINSRIHEFTVAAAGKPVMQKVALAMQRGLHVQALQTLKDSDPLQFGTEGALLQVILELNMGRLAEANQDLKVILEGDVKSQLFETLALTAAAAMGDYRKADATGESILEEIDNSPDMVRQMIFANLLPREEMNKAPKNPFTLLAVNQGHQVLTAGILGRPPAALVGNALVELDVNMRLYAAYFERLRQKATYLTLRGLICLEQGDTARARQFFDKAAGFGKDQVLGPTNGIPLAEIYLKFIDDAAKK